MKRVFALMLAVCLLCTACATEGTATPTEPITTVTTVSETVTSPTDTTVMIVEQTTVGTTSNTEVTVAATATTTEIAQAPTSTVTTTTTLTTSAHRSTTTTTTEGITLTTTQPAFTTADAASSAVTSTTASVATTKTKKTTTTAETTTTTTTITTTTTTTAAKKALRVLSIGNSLSFDAHGVLAALAKHEGTPFETLSLMHSGCSMKKHYRFWQENAEAYWPVSNGKVDWNIKITMNDALNEMGEWDIITIQEASVESCYPDEMVQYAQLLKFVVKQAQPNAKIYIHQTWALGDGNRYHTAQTGGTMESMWPQVKVGYDTMSQSLKLPLIPAGEAMYNLQKAYNARGLGESAYRDGLHVDEGWGGYMLALVWYRTLTGEIPSNTFENFKGPYIEDATVRKLVYDTAMNAVEAYM